MSDLSAVYREGDPALVCPGCQTLFSLPKNELHDPEAEAFGTLAQIVCPACHQAITLTCYTEPSKS